ncbi:MAG TPA: hypothetical protein ENJ87_06205 [Gammaproteobacteria bacterium]|nr:hypothetical protein [Gammaproteobacteria bacterium]
MSSAVSHKIDDYESLLVALQNVLGVVVPDERRVHLVERIEPLLSVHKLDSLALLAEKLRSEEGEIRADVLDVISQRQANWGVNPETKDVLHNYILAQLPEKARIWIVGCGQGQLAYSVAMEIAGFERKNGEAKNFELLGTELSRDDIRQAEEATYSSQQLMTLNGEYRNSFIIMDGKSENGQLKNTIRQSVHFSVCDLTSSTQAMGQMDLIICPEILVYFSNGVKTAIIQQFTDQLKSGGILLTGHNQSIPMVQGLERVEHPEGVFYRQKS